MKFIVKPRRVLAVLVAVLGLLTTGAATASATIDPVIDPVVYAYPATDLAEGDKITVVLHGFHPNETVGVTQCAIPKGWPEVCDFQHGINFVTNAGGDATGSVTVHVRWTGTDPHTGKVIGAVDCRFPVCTIGAASPVNHEGGTTPITFK
jgi:neocarzinostatin family protein